MQKSIILYNLNDICLVTMSIYMQSIRKLYYLLYLYVYIFKLDPEYFLLYLICHLLEV